MSHTSFHIVSYLCFRNYFTSSNINNVDYQMITYAGERYKDVIRAIEPNKNKNP